MYSALYDRYEVFVCNVAYSHPSSTYVPNTTALEAMYLSPTKGKGVTRLTSGLSDRADTNYCKHQALEQTLVLVMTLIIFLP